MNCVQANVPTLRAHRTEPVLTRACRGLPHVILTNLLPTFRFCTAMASETAATGDARAGGPETKTYTCSLSDDVVDWIDSFDSVTLNEDGSCEIVSASNAGRDSSSCCSSSGVWSVNALGLVECILDGGDRAGHTAYYKIEGATLVSIKQNSMDPEHEDTFCCPYGKPVRAVLE